MQQAKLAIEQFIAGSVRPVAIEPGCEPFPLVEGRYFLESRNGHLYLQVWDETRTLSRKLKNFSEQTTRRLSFTVERFGKRESELQLVDLDRDRTESVTRKATRLTYREQFRASLSRQFPSWRISEITSEPDLTRSLSPVFPRAFLVKGNRGWAAIGAPARHLDTDNVLSFGLIWLAHLRRRETKVTVDGLALFLPEGTERNTCLRMRELDGRVTAFRLFSCAEGHELPVDPADSGNVDSRLPVFAGRFESRIESWIRELGTVPHVETVSLPGAVSLRVRGLEFARAAGSNLIYGIQKKRVARDSAIPEIAALARELASLRSPGRAGCRDELQLQAPELWLESQVRAGLGIIEPSLNPSLVYSQAPTFAAAQRGVIDLLAVDHRGRLVILELKTSEDLHLPLQALDYWIRVKYHLDRGEFPLAGYFPGVMLRAEPPRVLLVAPSLHFHPSTETILSFIRPAFEVERIGLGAPWREDLTVVFRLRGAAGA